MDILIKGMEKPRCCGDCRFFKRGHNPFGEDFIFAQPWGDCLVSGEENVIEHDISENCPLVALPSHGDLIDRSFLKGASYEIIRFSDEEANKMFLELIDNAPTIVEATE